MFQKRKNIPKSDLSADRIINDPENRLNLASRETKKPIASANLAQTKRQQEPDLRLFATSLSANDREEIKSRIRATRVVYDFSSHKQQSLATNANASSFETTNATASDKMQSNSNSNNVNQRFGGSYGQYGSHQRSTTTTNISSSHSHSQQANAIHLSSSSQPISSSKSMSISEIPQQLAGNMRQQLSKQRTSSSGAIQSSKTKVMSSAATLSTTTNDNSKLNPSQEITQSPQHQRCMAELTAEDRHRGNMIKEEDLDVFPESGELESIGSLERDLPVELSFLMRQQAFCMARMNYLDRQLRELKESRHSTPVAATGVPVSGIATTTTAITTGAPTIPVNQNPATSQQHLIATPHQYHHHQHHQQQQQHYTSPLATSALCNQNQNYLYNHNNHPIRNHHMHPQQQHISTLNNPITNAKHGNFILSDDSGGEYSRATISDDDELSSLLDQIAKSIRPDQQRNSVGNGIPNQQQLTNHTSISSMNHQLQNLQQLQLQQQLQSQRSGAAAVANFSHCMGNQPQQFTFINPNQLHHQAVPVFVMGSPIAVAHTSSINSTVPGVHFQPEPRYNQYYEDFYTINSQQQQGASNSNNIPTTTNHASSLQRHNVNSKIGNNRTQQFDSSISAIEQLVSQKEKHQIRSQLKSTDNWLKVRSSGMCNLNDDLTNGNGGSKSSNGTTANLNDASNCGLDEPVTDQNPDSPSPPAGSLKS